MEVFVHAQGMTLRPLIRDSIEAHVRDGLRRYASRVARVSLTVDDEQGSPGSRSQHCRIELKMKSGRVVLLDERAENLLAAVSGATERIRHSVSRAVEPRAGELRSSESGRQPHASVA